VRLYPRLRQRKTVQAPELRQRALSRIQRLAQLRLSLVPLLQPEAQLVLRVPAARLSRAVAQPRLWRQRVQEPQPARLVASLPLQLQAALLPRQDASPKFRNALHLQQGGQ
jgi:hypothetical protein